MRATVILLLALIATNAMGQGTPEDDPFGNPNPFPSGQAAQDDDPFAGPSPFAAEDQEDAVPVTKVKNPFDVTDKEVRSMMGDEGGMEMMGMEMEEDAYGGGMGMMMGSEAPTEEDRFELGLQRAITALKAAKSEPERTALLAYVRRAFQDRYDRSILQRREELQKLKARLAKLDSDLKRREAAKSRVIEVQMQSVQLAAEGLMELDGR